MSTELTFKEKKVIEETTFNLINTILGHHTLPLIITGNIQNNTKIWQINTNESIAMDTIDDYELSISPNEKYLITSNEDDIVKIYNYDSKNSIELQKDNLVLYDTAWNKESTLFANGCDEENDIYNVRIWDVETGISIKKLSGHTNSIFTVASHPTEDMFASGSLDGSIRIWSWTGDCIKTIYLSNHSEITDTNELKVDVLKSSHNYLLSSSWEGNDRYNVFIRIWSWTTGECLRVMNNFYGGFDNDRICWREDTLLIHHCLDNGTIHKGTLHVWDTSLHPTKWSEIGIIKRVECATFDNENNIVICRYTETNEYDEVIEDEQSETELSEIDSESDNENDSENDSETESFDEDDFIILDKKHGYKIIIYDSCFSKFRQLERTKIIKQELMEKTWHPNRVSKWIEAGFEVTD